MAHILWYSENEEENKKGENMQFGAYFYDQI